MKRIIPGILLAAFWIWLLLSGTALMFWFACVVGAGIAGQEYLKMMLPSDCTGLERACISLLLLLPVLLLLLDVNAGPGGGLFLALLALSTMVVIRYGTLENPFDLLLKLAFGAFYIGFLASHLALIRFLPEGNYWLIILTGLTAGADTGAYYCGSLFGRHLLCPAVSPKKTVEGAVGGLVFGMIVACIFSYLLLGSVRWGMLLPVSFLLILAGMLGDLCESVIKRATHTKDSGTILLGHGGVLDRADSLLFTAPLLYYLYVFSGG